MYGDSDLRLFNSITVPKEVVDSDAKGRTSRDLLKKPLIHDGVDIAGYNSLKSASKAENANDNS